LAHDISPLRIAFVITDLHVGGAERCCVELVARLNRAKYEPVVYSLFPPPPPERAALWQELQTLKIPVHFLNARSWLSLPRVLFSLWRHFRRQQPCLVQSFLFHANFVAAIAARLAKVPYVFTGIRVAEPRSLHLQLARWTDRWVTRHVCVSQAVAQFSQQQGRLPQKKLVVIPNGLDLQRFSTAKPADLQELGIRAGGRVIACIGRLDAQKGLDWLLSVVPQILPQFSQHDLLFVGDGPARKRLETQAHASAFASRIHFAGWRADVPKILAASDVLVLTSQWEGMPNVVLEAMAAAKPIVATNAQGVAELLGPLASEQMVQFGDSHGFLTKLKALLSNPSLAGKIGQENQFRAANCFSLHVMVESYDILYTQAAEFHASIALPAKIF
jgi:glycosyltransferase involved in cell wall biosynthesis